MPNNGQLNRRYRKYTRIDGKLILKSELEKLKKEQAEPVVEKPIEEQVLVKSEDSEEEKHSRKYYLRMKHNWLKREEKRKARLLREAEKKQQKELKKWINSNLNEINIDKSSRLWNDNSRNIRDKLIDVAVKSLSMADGVDKANNAMQDALNLNNSEIDAAEAQRLLTKIFRIQIAKIFLDNTEIDGPIKERILNLMLIKEFVPRRSPGSILNELGLYKENQANNNQPPVSSNDTTMY